MSVIATEPTPPTAWLRAIDERTDRALARIAAYEPDPEIRPPWPYGLEVTISRERAGEAYDAYSHALWHSGVAFSEDDLRAGAKILGRLRLAMLPLPEVIELQDFYRRELLRWQDIDGEFAEQMERHHHAAEIRAYTLRMLERAALNGEAAE